MNDQKKYVVTGANQGIGLATAMRLAADGATVIILSMETADISTICGKIEDNGGNPVFINTDIRSEESITNAVRQLEDLGTIDGFINCAAVVNLSSTLEITTQKLDLMNAVNSRAPFLIAKCLYQKMQSASTPNIMMVSPPVNLDERWLSAHLPYTASRYLASICANGLAHEFSPYGIKVNTIWPKYSIAAPGICNIINGTYGDMSSMRRKPEIMADAIAIMMQNDELTGQNLIDEQILLDNGIEDLDVYRVNDSKEALYPSEFIS